MNLKSPCNFLTAPMKTQLAEHPSGRVLLHLACLLRNGNVRWHWAGMKRELQKLATRRPAEAPTAI
jgi:hypothetical protein